MEINEKKSEFRKTSIEFLGRNIEQNIIRPKVEKLQGIKEIKVPVNKKKLQEFLGLVSYYRKFIEGCSKIAGPLYDLTKDKVPFNWKEIHDTAFNKLKEILMGQVKLFQPDYKKKVHLRNGCL